VAEELLATEISIIRVLQPTVSQALIRKIVHMLGNCQTRHEPGRQRRAARQVGVNRSQPLAEKVPIDRPCQFGQRVPGIDNLTQPSTKKIMLAANTTSL
jgi:hypothetical protein